MTLPPLYNACAAFEPDAEQRAQLQQRLLASGFFQSVQRTEHDWLLAIDPVGPDTPVYPARESVFCEHTQASLQRRTELLFASERSPETLQQFPGDFTFLHLPTDGSIILVRSCAGRVPLYYASYRERILV